MPTTNKPLLRVWYGATTTPPTTKVDGSMYVTTGHGNNLAQLYFDLDGERYVLKGGTLDHSFTVGNVTFNGAADRSVDLYTYSFGEGTTNGTFRVTPSLNGTAQTAFEVAIHGLGSAAYRDASSFLAANATAVQAAKLSVGLTIYNNSTTGVTFGTDGQDKSVYIGSDLVVGNGTATAMTTTALTNGSVHLIPLYQTGENTWAAKRRIAISGAGGVSVTTSASGAITITGTTYTALPNPNSITFTNDGNGANSGVTYNGSEDKTISYNTIGAAAANTAITAASFGTDNKTLTLTRAAGNITVALPATAAINISGKAATAGTADKVGHTLDLQIGGTSKVTFDGSGDKTFNVTYADLGVIPLQYIPATAQERLYVTALTSTNNTDAKAVAAAISAGSVQAGDVVQVNAGSGVTPGDTGSGIGKMYFIYDNNGTLAYKEFTAGTAATATQADHVGHGLTIVGTGIGTNGANVSVTFNGSEDKTITIPYATASNAGLVSTGTQTFAGDKTFNGKITGTTALFSGSVTSTSGGFIGDLTGKAQTAGTADQVGHSVTFSGTAFTSTDTSAITFNGSGDKTVGVFKAATASAAGHWGFVPTPPANSQQKFLTGGGEWWALEGTRGITCAYDDTTNKITIRHTNDQITPRTDLSGLSTDTTASILTAEKSFTVAHVKYDANGHVTGAENKAFTVAKLTYTANSNFASEGYEIGKFSDGTTEITLRGGVVWETFS